MKRAPLRPECFFPRCDICGLIVLTPAVKEIRLAAQANDFFIAGGQFRRADLRTRAQIAALGKRVVINCTGYGARALWKDDTLVPVRGQIARLIRQPEVRYGLVYRQVLTVPRRDGLVVQSFAGGEMQGYGDTNEAPDRAEAEQAVTTLAELFSSTRA